MRREGGSEGGRNEALREGGSARLVAPRRDCTAYSAPYAPHRLMRWHPSAVARWARAAAPATTDLAYLSKKAAGPSRPKCSSSASSARRVAACRVRTTSAASSRSGRDSRPPIPLPLALPYSLFPLRHLPCLFFPALVPPFLVPPLLHAPLSPSLQLSPSRDNSIPPNGSLTS